MIQDQFSIYQVKAGREYRPYQFHAYTYMLQHGLAITEDHYDLVYTSSLYPGDDPGIIRNRINEKRPKRFHGHSVSTGDVIAINQAGVTQCYYLEQVGFIRLPGFIQPSSQSSDSDSQKATGDAGSGGDERIITLGTTDYLLKGRKGLWLAEDMILVDGRPFFLLQHQDFGNDAAFAVVDEYGNQAAPDSYDGFTDDVIRQIRQFLQKEKEQPEAGSYRHERIRDAFSAIPFQKNEENIQSSYLQQSTSAPLLENWQKSYQNGEYIIYDWKRSDKIIDKNGLPIKNNQYGEKALPPIDNLDDSPYYHYALQLSLYKYILEKNYSITVSKLRLGIFHPSYNKPYVLEMPYLQNEIDTLFGLRSEVIF